MSTSTPTPAPVDHAASLGSILGGLAVAIICLFLVWMYRQEPIDANGNKPLVPMRRNACLRAVYSYVCCLAWYGWFETDAERAWRNLCFKPLGVPQNQWLQQQGLQPPTSAVVVRQPQQGQPPQWQQQQQWEQQLLQQQWQEQQWEQQEQQRQQEQWQRQQPSAPPPPQQEVPIPMPPPSQQLRV